MLAPAKVEETRRLLHEGKLSQRRIAKVVGVSRATVSAIASGRRPDYEARRRDQGDDYEPLGPIERCPECGGRVYAPCRLCRVRKLVAHEEQLARAYRRRAREQAAQRLLAAVRKSRDAEQATTTAEHAAHLPVDETGPSDSR